MKKKIAGFLVVFLICTVVGCSQQSGENIDTKDAIEQIGDIDISKVKKIGNKIAENELFVASEDINLNFYKNFTHIPYFKIDCLSSSEISTDGLKVSIDIDTPYSVSVTEEEEFDLYSFGLFTGYDWKKAKELKEKDEDAYNQYQKKFLNAYNKMTKNEIGELHHYIIVISFDMKNSVHTETINKIQIEYNGEIINKNIGKIVIDCDEKNPKKEKSLNVTCLAMNDIYIAKNSEGYMEVMNSNMYKTKNNVELSNIYMLNKDSKIQNCNINIHSSKENYDMNWEGETIELESDSELGLDILLSKDDFKDKVYYQCSDYLVIEYKEEAETYKTGTELYFSTNLTGYQLYAYFLDGIDIEIEEE